jgi:hypothetical protein
MYGQIFMVSENGNLEEVAELAYLIQLDPAEYSSESPQLQAYVRQHYTPQNTLLFAFIWQKITFNGHPYLYYCVALPTYACL